MRDRKEENVTKVLILREKFKKKLLRVKRRFEQYKTRKKSILCNYCF